MRMNWKALGKKRSRFGKMLDKEGLTQNDLAKASGVNRTTISKLCNEDDVKVKYSTAAKIKKGFKKLGINKNVDKYLDL